MSWLHVFYVTCIRTKPRWKWLEVWWLPESLWSPCCREEQLYPTEPHSECRWVCMRAGWHGRVPKVNAELKATFTGLHLGRKRQIESWGRHSYFRKNSGGNKWALCQADGFFSSQARWRGCSSYLLLSLASQFPGVFPRTLSRAWLSSLCTNVSPAGRVLDVTRKFISNEPTEWGNLLCSKQLVCASDFQALL